MKTLEYVRKYNLDKGVNFNHNEFVIDLTTDFTTLLEVGNSTKSFKGYNNTVNAIRMKWDAINNKTMGQLPEKLWNYFYATVIVKLREQLFPDIMQAQREKSKRDYERRQEYRRFQEREFNSDWFYESLFVSLLRQMMIPTQSFETLGLDTSATKEEINSKYRELCMVHHPDKGGKQDNFIAITEAKNKAMMYAQSRAEKSEV
jgi:hypothetical protein